MINRSTLQGRSMDSILIICGAERAGISEGRYNRSLAAAAEALLGEHYRLLTTSIEAGYDVEQEQEKFRQAQVVIWQFPVFWFNCPASVKQYIDRVFAHGVFFERKLPYGTGGLMGGKRYLLSTTWNAPESAFADPATFYQGATLDDAMIAMHQAHRYVGMEALPSFAVYNVVREPDYERAEQRWRDHLRRLLLS
ncbi:NAD(P)H-dependent oxidoreductase [Aestuariirhabdus litorea]|uniref:Flavodoxin family protein n=1 Tax=Aestuariirhabdus litorea TaxID=2528527 RepID=A0A3P3VJA2_9GAMM|nr:NAD(P)H-dependent oxidoreductase [Aestuariirhabdus litorea]RRJ82427.1 flavodoxin family protein [Aestuariirhabdus litorea]RWW92590.1 flavodoxin family protein [Endozoicomonadaceae bacterium GTF-13]